MRSPQSSARRLSATAVPVIALASLLTMLPARVHAAASHLSGSQTTLRYGRVVLGQTETLIVAVTNNGQANVTVSRVTTSNAKFKVSRLRLPQVLTAGENLEVSVTFAPTATGWAGAQVTFVSNASNPVLSLRAGGTGVTREEVTASPTSVSFGNVGVGGTATLPVVLTNTRAWKITLTSLQTTGSAFSVSGARFPLSLAAGQSVKLKATFKPRVVGLTGGSSFVSGPGLDIPLTGTGTAASASLLTIIPTTLSFGNVSVGTIQTLTAGLIAKGGNVTVSSVASSSSPFAVPGAVFPLTIPAGQEVSLNVTFTPQNTGKTSAMLSFASNAANSPTPEPLAGTGTAPFVILSWSASTSDVTGYNVYRNTSGTGSYTRINSSLDPDTTYTDVGVVGGTTYYYVTTAVNSSGLESGHSNQVRVAVP